MARDRVVKSAAVEQWISSSHEPALPPISQLDPLPSITPSTLGHTPSSEPPPPVPTLSDAAQPVLESVQPTVHEKIAAAGWGSIEARDNSWHQGFIAVIAILSLWGVVKLKDYPKNEIVIGVVLILIFWFGLSAIGKLLIKPKRFTCSQCSGKLQSDRPGPCPHCDASLT